jgi:DNA processing protein
MEELTAKFYLNASAVFNHEQQNRILQHFGSARRFLENDREASEWIGEKNYQSFLKTVDRLNDNRTLERLENDGVHFLTRDDNLYPPHFHHLECPPHLLYIKGQIPEMGCYGLSIIGTRRPTIYGRQMAQSFASTLASEGMTIISGLAKGIDGVALQSAVQAGGATIALLGTGIDRIYPQENAKLFEKICERGCLVSEFAPGAAPLKHHFPFRNRLISAWALGVLVVEATIRSGTRRTVDWALQQGKDCFAIPGPANSDASAFPHSMIRDGAHLVERPEEILDFYQHLVSDHQKTEISSVDQIPEHLKQMGLSPQTQSIDQLIEHSGLEYLELTQQLNQAVLSGEVLKFPGENYALATD